ncbi:DUF6443 domain-containing protein [Ancylomarina sp. DW003]|nr:RHS repeat-associated core domain-containing protein [Ancylomarina sp. DW003]MDE5423337.1 DUF6443 domain-containing protein [Ancylomarina sp. DW003]
MTRIIQRTLIITLSLFFCFNLKAQLPIVNQDSLKIPKVKTESRTKSAGGGSSSGGIAPVSMPIMPSAHAASLVRAATASPNLYTGAVNVSIPLFTLPAQGMSVPIGLVYQSNGVKVNDKNGPLGMTWNLQGGGAVARIVRGYPDEFRGELKKEIWTSEYQKKQKSKIDVKGFWYNKIPYDFTSVEKSFNKILDYSEGKKKEIWDSEPDKYIFSAPGLAGSFYIPKKGVKFTLHCDADVDLQVSYKDNEINGFLITTVAGVCYEFGMSSNFVEKQAFSKESTICEARHKKKADLCYSVEYEFEPSVFIDTKMEEEDAYISTWYLKSITTPFYSDYIQYQYKEDEDKVNIQAKTVDAVLDNALNYYKYTNEKQEIEVGRIPLNESYLSQIYSIKQTTVKVFKPKRLIGISSRSSKIVFDYTNDNKDKRINRIALFGADKKTVIKTNVLEYQANEARISELNCPLMDNRIVYRRSSYSGKAGTARSNRGSATTTRRNTDNSNQVKMPERFFLSNIKELSKSGSDQIDLFSFEYLRPEFLPEIGSQSQNHFGYYTAYPDFKSLFNIDSESNYYSLLALNNRPDRRGNRQRSVSPIELTVPNGLLAGMRNPTGAQTQFIYESKPEGNILKKSIIKDGKQVVQKMDYVYNAPVSPYGSTSNIYPAGDYQFGLSPWGRTEIFLTQASPLGYGNVELNTNGSKSQLFFTTAFDYDNAINESTFLKKTFKNVVLDWSDADTGYYTGGKETYVDIQMFLDQVTKLYPNQMSSINSLWKETAGNGKNEEFNSIEYLEYVVRVLTKKYRPDGLNGCKINYHEKLVTEKVDHVGRPTERDQLRGKILRKESYNLAGKLSSVEEYNYTPFLLNEYTDKQQPFIVSKSYTEAGDDKYIVPYSINYETLRLNKVQTTTYTSDGIKLKSTSTIDKYASLFPLLPEQTSSHNINNGDKVKTIIAYKSFQSSTKSSRTKSAEIKDDGDDDSGNGGGSANTSLKKTPYPKYLPNKQTIYKNGLLLSGSEVVFDEEKKLAKHVKSYIGGDYEITDYYDKFDSYGRILQTHGRDGIYTSYRYKGSQIELIAENATYDQIKSGKPEDLRKKLPDANFISVTYSPEGFMKTKTGVNGLSVYYDYDDFGRFKQLSDFEKNALKGYEYQYGRVGQKVTEKKLGIGEMQIGLSFVVGGYTERTSKGLSTKGKNYIASYTFRKEGALFQERNKSEKAFKSLEYQDGLGRAIQQIALKTLPGEYSMVKGFEYDSLGRQSTQYRNLPMLTNGSYKDSWKTYLKSAYQSSYKSESLFDDYNRLSKQGRFGENYALNAHASNYSYGMNKSGIPSYSIEQGDDEFKAKTYASGTLFRNVVYFEGITNVSYKNMDGQVVRKAAIKGKVTTDPTYETALITDYVYDDYGNLRAILPPQAKGDVNQDKFVYQFHYDKRGRVYKKKIPGAGSIVLKYDDLDRPINETDARGNTTYVKYDKFSRPIETGLRLRSATGTDSDVPLQKSYYDNYEFDFARANPPSFKNAKYNKGRSTGSETKVLGEEVWIKSVNYYDKRGRLIEVISQNNTGGIDKIKNSYDFEGKVLSSVLIKNYKGKEWIVTREYAYGKTGELLDVSHKVNKERKVILNAFKYKPDGALAEKRMHNGKIKTKYEYDELDRMVKTATEKHFELELAFDSNLDGTQNTPYYDGSLSAMAWKTAGKERMTYSFDYDDYKNLKAANSNDHAYTASYSYNKNGNIDQLQRFDSIGLYQSLTYKYKGNQLDSLKRNNTEEVEVWPGDANNNTEVDVDDLLDVGYNWYLKVRPRDKRSDEWMAWWVKRRKGDKTVFSDSNGDGFINEMDTVAINQNLLKSHPTAKINKNNTYGYQYDANGNMVFDEYKNIEIHYNHLNLPDTIIAHGQGKIINVYLADGSLLQRKVIVIEGQGEDAKEKEIDRLDYQGEFLFQEDRLSKIITEEGYVSPSETNKKKLTYFYVVSDHLGHSRVVLDEKENVVQTTAYYPYGLPITDLSSETKYKYLYTGKEFVGEFGLNWYDHHARQYDAEIGRWSAIDPQLVSASPYMGMGNNPMMMIDPDGENPLVAAIIIGAVIAGGSYTASVAFSDGGFSNWNWGQFVSSVGVGAVSGAITYGIGGAFGGVGGGYSSFGAKAINEMGRAFAHGIAQGSLSGLQGGDIRGGFASGALGSLGGSAFGAVGGKFAKSMGGTVGFSALSGGIGAELSGGDFWRGAGAGATIGLLNHTGQQLKQKLERPGRINLKKKPVRGFKRWMRYINRYNGVDPESGKAFNLSDMVDPRTVPKKNWFMGMFDLTTSISGTSDGVRWSIQDNTISSSHINNITRISPYEKMVGNKPLLIIRAYRYQEVGVFSLMFSDYNSFNNYCKYIGLNNKQ